MGIFNRLFSKNNRRAGGKEDGVETSPHTLAEDIPKASAWVAEALNSSGYKADYTLESLQEIDRFFDEQQTEGGILSKNRGSILFSLGAYIGETAIKLYGGQWHTDDSDPQGEITISVKLANGTVIWPVQKCMKRYQNGAEDSLYAYLLALND